MSERNPKCPRCASLMVVAGGEPIPASNLKVMLQYKCACGQLVQKKFYDEWMEANNNPDGFDVKAHFNLIHPELTLLKLRAGIKEEDDESERILH